jgi:hypothetical protein
MLASLLSESSIRAVAARFARPRESFLDCAAVTCRGRSSAMPNERMLLMTSATAFRNVGFGFVASSTVSKFGNAEVPKCPVIDESYLFIPITFD